MTVGVKKTKKPSPKRATEPLRASEAKQEIKSSDITLGRIFQLFHELVLQSIPRLMKVISRPFVSSTMI